MTHVTDLSPEFRMLLRKRPWLGDISTLLDALEEAEARAEAAEQKLERFVTANKQDFVGKIEACARCGVPR